MEVVHEWVARARCPECSQYLWTNPGSPNVICSCGSSMIIDDVIVSGEAVTSSYDFRQAVIADTGISSEELTLRQVTP